MRPHQLLLVASIVVSICAYSLSSDQVDGLFYPFMALSYFGFAVAFYMHSTNRATELICHILAGLTFTNLFDELFLDPYIKEWKEYTLAGAWIVWSIAQFKYPKLSPKTWLQKQ